MLTSLKRREHGTRRTTSLVGRWGRGRGGLVFPRLPRGEQAGEDLPGSRVARLQVVHLLERFCGRVELLFVVAELVALFVQQGERHQKIKVLRREATRFRERRLRFVEVPEQIAQEAELVVDLSVAGREPGVALQEFGFLLAEPADFVRVAVVLLQNRGQLRARARRMAARRWSIADCVRP